MNKCFNSSGVALSLNCDGLDNVPAISAFEKIQEEKISALIYDDLIHGRAFVNGAVWLRCDQEDSRGEHYNSYTCGESTAGGLVQVRSDSLNNAPCRDMARVDGLENASLFLLSQCNTPYKGLRSAAHFFGIKNTSYDPYHLHTQYSRVTVISPSKCIHGTDSESEEKAIQDYLNARLDMGFPNGVSLPIPELPQDVRNIKIPMGFFFTNSVGEKTMAVFKCYRRVENFQFAKCYWPLIRYYDARSKSVWTLKTGYPDKQILFNLDSIGGATTVIVCSSLEAALANQQNTPTGEVVFTAFVCDDHRFDQVDFTPLKGKSVKLLISNHSGMTLAESYQEAQTLYEYLRDEVKLEEIGFIQMAVEYPDLVDVYDIDALMAAHRQQKPKIIDGSVIEMNEAEFSEMVVKATSEITRKHEQSQDQSFWRVPVAALSAAEEAEPAPEKLTDKTILRPFIVAGHITTIESDPGIGKSCFTTALCAQIAGSKAPFLKGRCLTRCTPLDNPKRGYKVVCLTFDGDGAAIPEHRKDFAHDLGENDGNFIQRDMIDDRTDYKKECNYNKFVALVDSFRNEGTPEQPVDVLVIDTLLEFSDHNVEKVHLLLRKLISDFPNMAIVLTHHLNTSGSSYGGTKSTMLPRAILKLYRTKDQVESLGTRKATLFDPFTFAVEKFNANKIPVDGESFSVKLDDNGHFIEVDPARSQDEMRKVLVDEYRQRYGLSQDEIGRLFGVSGRSIRTWKGV